MDTRQWLTAAGAWSNAQFTAVKDLGADGVITGEFELSIGYSKGLLILRAGETELANVLLPSAPNLTGDRFGIQADYEAGGFADPDGYVGIQGFAIHDLTPEVIDPHSHAASGGDTPAPAASEWTTLYKAASYNNGGGQRGRGPFRLRERTHGCPHYNPQRRGVFHEHIPGRHY